MKKSGTKDLVTLSLSTIKAKSPMYPLQDGGGRSLPHSTGTQKIGLHFFNDVMLPSPD
jgi:hypothetical protein